MSKEQAKKAWAFIIDSACFIYMVAAVISLAHGLVTGGIAGFVDSLIIMVAVACVSFVALICVSSIFIAVWGSDVLGK